MSQTRDERVSYSVQVRPSHEVPTSETCGAYPDDEDATSEDACVRRKNHDGNHHNGPFGYAFSPAITR